MLNGQTDSAERQPQSQLVKCRVSRLFPSHSPARNWPHPPTGALWREHGFGVGRPANNGNLHDWDQDSSGTDKVRRSFSVQYSPVSRHSQRNVEWGFEKGLYAWAPINGMQATHFTSGGRTGGDWLRVRRTQLYSIYDSAVIVSGDAPQSVKAYGWFKRANSAQGGAQASNSTGLSTPMRLSSPHLCRGSQPAKTNQVVGRAAGTKISSSPPDRSNTGERGTQQPPRQLIGST